MIDTQPEIDSDSAERQIAKALVQLFFSLFPSHLNSTSNATEGL